jgi:predicted dehydrogenase
MADLRIGIVGCGKVSERFHIPVVAAFPGVTLQALVDRDLDRASELARLHGVRDALPSVEGLAGRVDAAIVAVPHHLHAEIAGTLLRQGIHVLVEKPMALDVGSCDAMIAAAEESGAVLAVGLVRRFYQASRLVKELLDDGVIGRVTGFDAREGAIFNWQVATDATFRKEMGGGVLADIGTHVLDLLLWWLGDATDLRYADDAMGGVEAECEIGLSLARGGAGTVELSRTRLLRNSIVITGERGTIEVGPGFDPEVRLRFTGSERRLSGFVEASGVSRATRLEDVFVAQLDDFTGAIREGHAPFVSGDEGRRAIELMEACRGVRRALDLPWLTPRRDPAPDARVGR